MTLSCSPGCGVDNCQLPAISILSDTEESSHRAKRPSLFTNVSLPPTPIVAPSAVLFTKKDASADSVPKPNSENSLRATLPERPKPTREIQPLKLTVKPRMRALAPIAMLVSAVDRLNSNANAMMPMSRSTLQLNSRGEH